MARGSRHLGITNDLVAQECWVELDAGATFDTVWDIRGTIFIQNLLSCIAKECVRGLVGSTLFMCIDKRMRPSAFSKSMARDHVSLDQGCFFVKLSPRGTQSNVL